MIMNRLRTNQLSLAATDWYFRYLDVLEAKDINRHADYLADDVAMQFNNSSTVEGKAAVVDLLDRRWRRFRSISHEMLNIIGSDRGFVSESLNHYTRHDQTTVTARAVVFTDRNADGSIASVRVYSDTSSVFDGIGGRETTGRSLGMPCRRPSETDHLVDGGLLS